MNKRLIFAVVAIATMISSGFTTLPAHAAYPPCTITVTTSGETVSGTSNGDVICLQADNLIVNALGGDDIVIDDGLNNTVYLGEGLDIYDGTLGEDGTVDGGSGNDTITGTPGEDELTGGDGDDTIIGGDANDTLNGGLGADELAGSAGEDILNGEAGLDELDGGEGTDTLNGGPDADILIGGSGNDSMNGGLGDDELAGGVGDDNIEGDAGDDSLDGGDGTDTINGGDGADTFVGGSGNDTMNGGVGNDDLAGGIGNDSIFGESGQDSLSGQEGDDALAGGSDLDTIDGGIGLNSCDFTSGEIQVSTCRYDDAAPVLRTFEIIQDSVDVGQSSARVDIRMSAFDATGLGMIYITCGPFSAVARSSSSSSSVVSAYGYYASTNSAWYGNALGSVRDFTVDLYAMLPQGISPGQYSCSGSGSDTLGNRKQYSIQDSITILRTGNNFDDAAPVLRTFEIIQDSVDVGQSSARVDIRMSAFDATGLGMIYITCGPFSAVARSSSSSSSVVSAYGYYASTNSAWYGNALGSVRDFTVDLYAMLPQGISPGQYSCSGSGSDTLGNRTQYSIQDSITILRTGNNFDDAAPVLRTFEIIQDSVDVGQSSARVDIRMSAFDATGLGMIYITCGPFSAVARSSSSSSSVVSAYGYYASTNSAWYGNALGSVRDFTVDLYAMLPQGISPGQYSCSGSGSDTLGNRKQYSIQDSITILRTPAGQPSLPTSVKFEATRPTSGTLSWSPPVSLGSPNLFGYVVEISEDANTWTALPGGATAGTSLAISNLKEGTKYWFRVRGENGGTVGQDPQFMSLNWGAVEFTTPQATSPDAPTNLVVSNIASSSFRLAWTAPTYSGGRDISNFTVEYSTNNGATWQNAKSGTSTSLSFDVTTAAPGTRYLLRVAAVNVIGASEYLTGEVTTLATVPTAPRSLAAGSITSNSLTLSWLLPTSNGGAAISDYKVEFSSNAGVSWTEIAHEASNNLGFNVSTLQKNRTYQFRVSAINEGGVGAASNIVSVTTLATAASAPRNIATSNVLANSATISWAAPSDNGGLAITDYKVETSRDGTTWTAISRSASTNTNINLTGLAPLTSYFARVSALNSQGFSETTQVEFTTLATVPTAPRTLTAGAVTSNSLTLSWLLPTSNGGAAISDYKVEFSSNAGVSWTEITHTASNNLAFDVTSLRSNQAYRFRVSAINEGGVGAASNIVSVNTLVGPPQEPTNLTSSGATATGASLAWVAPTNTGGSRLTDYLVQLSRDGGNTWTTVTKRASTSLTLSLTGLAAATTYQVRVAAVNARGAGATATTSFTTLAGPPSAPTNLRSSDVTGTTATIAWDLPPSNGGSAITNYKVEVSSNCRTFTVLPRTVSNSLAQNVTNLLPGVAYCFRVSTITAIGTSPVSSMLTVTTIGSPPNAPTSLAVRASATQVTLSWRAATVTGGGPVRNYIVEYSRDGGATWINVNKSVSTSVSLAIRNLTRSTAYLFRVYAVNDSGTSPVSANLAVTTPAR